MRFLISTIALLFSVSIVSGNPVPKKQSTTSSAIAAATSAAAASGGSVLTAAAYNDFQISAGTAGTAETQANALFANINQNNLASVSASDLKIIKGIHDAAEDAEVNAFNPAIDAASGDAATALQVKSHCHKYSRGHLTNKEIER